MGDTILLAGTLRAFSVPDLRIEVPATRMLLCYRSFGQIFSGHFYCFDSLIMQMYARPDIHSTYNFVNTDTAPVSR